MLKNTRVKVFTFYLLLRENQLGVGTPPPPRLTHPARLGLKTLSSYWQFQVVKELQMTLSHTKIIKKIPAIACKSLRASKSRLTTDQKNSNTDTFYAV